jgi:hypothetical protein
MIFRKPQTKERPSAITAKRLPESAPKMVAWSWLN